MVEKEAPRKTFYHGSSVKGIRVLTPFAASHNTIKKSVVYLTPNETLALFYIWNRIYRFVTFEEDERGVVVYTEWYENQFEDLTKGLSGSVYECADDPCIHATHVAGVFNSDVPVRISKETVIDDVFEELQKRIADGRVVLRRYRSLGEAEKESIVKETIVRAIHMEHLLNAEPTEYTAAKSAFIKEHFPDSWSIAEKMSDEEVKTMIDAWRGTH